jgi:hypothetical protein
MLMPMDMGLSMDTSAAAGMPGPMDMPYPAPPPQQIQNTPPHHHLQSQHLPRDGMGMPMHYIPSEPSAPPYPPHPHPHHREMSLTLQDMERMVVGLPGMPPPPHPGVEGYSMDMGGGQVAMGHNPTNVMFGGANVKYEPGATPPPTTTGSELR